MAKRGNRCGCRCLNPWLLLSDYLTLQRRQPSITHRYRKNTDVYSVGIPPIDEQHKRLIRLINELHEAMMQGTGNQALSSILSDLIRYTKEHFAFEEKMLATRNYSALAAHKAEHVDLTREVVKLRDNFQSGKLMMTLDVMRFLKRWLASHILEKDLRYAKELKG